MSRPHGGTKYMSNSRLKPFVHQSVYIFAQFILGRVHLRHLVKMVPCVFIYREWQQFVIGHHISSFAFFSFRKLSAKHPETRTL